MATGRREKGGIRSGRDSNPHSVPLLGGRKSLFINTKHFGKISTPRLPVMLVGAVHRTCRDTTTVVSAFYQHPYVATGVWKKVDYVLAEAVTPIRFPTWEAEKACLSTQSILLKHAHHDYPKCSWGQSIALLGEANAPAMTKSAAAASERAPSQRGWKASTSGTTLPRPT